jgi:Na+/melibiose symporter-like transporter
MEDFLWRPRVLYTTVFLWISITGGRFLAPFLEHEASLSATQIGSLLALHQAMSVLTSSVAGSYADSMERTYPGKGRATVLVLGVCLGGIMFLLHGLGRLFPTVIFFDSMTWYGGLRIMYSASTSFVFPVIDGMCLEFLKHHSCPQQYGKERLYGAISWAVTNLCMAPALDYVGFIIFYPLTIISTLLVVMTIHLYSQERQEMHALKKRTNNSNLDETVLTETDENIALKDLQSENHEKQSMISLLRMMLISWFGVAFIIAMVSLSSGQALVENLIFLFFEVLGSSYSLMGATVVLTVVFEIPIFHVAPTLLQRYGSGLMLLTASASYIVRVIGYTLIPNGKIGYVLLLEPLHGVTFACATTAGVDFVSGCLPPGYEASGQGLLQLFTGIGSVIGLLWGGWVEEELGPRAMYRVAAFVVLVGNSGFAIALLRRHGSSTSNRHILLSSQEEDLVEMTDCSVCTEACKD